MPQAATTNQPLSSRWLARCWRTCPTSGPSNMARSRSTCRAPWVIETIPVGSPRSPRMGGCSLPKIHWAYYSSWVLGVLYMYIYIYTCIYVFCFWCETTKTICFLDAAPYIPKTPDRDVHIVFETILGGINTLQIVSKANLGIFQALILHFEGLRLA